CDPINADITLTPIIVSADITLGGGGGGPSLRWWPTVLTAGTHQASYGFIYRCDAAAGDVILIAPTITTGQENLQWGAADKTHTESGNKMILNFLLTPIEGLLDLYNMRDYGIGNVVLFQSVSSTQGHAILSKSTAV
ncbi:MAG: hypothetical protein ACRC2U_05015, partial [Aeromonas sp.]